MTHSELLGRLGLRIQTAPDAEDGAGWIPDEGGASTYCERHPLSSSRTEEGELLSLLSRATEGG